jgi:tetratricopeptide (TPR) repeat protein
MLVKCTQAMIRVTLLVLILSFSLSAQDQQFYNQAEAVYMRGLENLNAQQFGAAREAFKEYLRTAPAGARKVEADFYIAYCGLFLENLGSDARIDEFSNTWREHPLAKGAYVALGNYYFEKGDWDKAIRYLAGADLYFLADEEFAKANFRLGLSYYQTGSNEKALVYLDRVKGGGSSYSNEAFYYSGLTALKLGNYFRARQDLLRVAEHFDFRNQVPYYLARIYLEEENYAELSSYAARALDIPRVNNRNEIFLLAAEADFRLANYAKALERYEAYLTATRTRPQEDVRYKMGYSYLQTGRKDQALEQFKTITGNDLLGQMAAYYSGHIHAGQGNAQFAATSFQRASSMNFNAEASQDAAFNFAKVSIELGRFRDALNILENFAKNYPGSPLISQANDLIIDALLNTNDYAKAIEYIESMPNRTERINRVYQKVTFFRGAEYYNDQRYPLAVQLFRKSLEHPFDRTLIAEAHFWIGESFSAGKRYAEAIEAYNAALRQNPSNQLRLDIQYGLGYAYFNTQQYTQALPLFRTYIQALERQTNTQNYADALLRLADCQFVLKDYRGAIATYDKAIMHGNPEQDYAHYQKGLVFGFLNNPAEAKVSFETVINRFRQSRYYDNALLQLAQVDFEAGNYREAIRGYSRLIEQRGNSPLVPYALQYRAIANVNLRNFPDAERDYRAILDRYLNHPTARGAILGLQDVMAQTGSKDFDRYLARYRSANPDKQALESIEFESAKGLYFNLEYPRAITALQNFLRTYPQSAFLAEARFYLAESFYRTNQNRQALELHTLLANTPGFPQQNRSLDRAAELEMELKNYRQSITYYTRLRELSQNRRDEYTALDGLMRAHFALNEYEQTARFANLILEQGNVTASAQGKALLHLGKAALGQRNINAARDHFLNAARSSQDEFGAEAQFLLAKIEYDRKEYRRSIDILFDLNNQFGSYDLWLGKSFLLLADNYIALEEYLQAKATLNSVSENSPLREIRDEAREKLRKLDELNKDN